MKFFSQFDQMDCGPACLKMISSFYGRDYSLRFLREFSYITKEGVSMLGLSQAAEKIGFETFGAEVGIDYLKQNNPVPCILYWDMNHFVVLYNIKAKKKIFNATNNKKNEVEYHFYVADPAHGKNRMSESEFIECWKPSEDKKGFAMFLTPSLDFLNRKKQKTSFSTTHYLFSQIKQYKSRIIWLLISFLIISCITLAFPFLTKKLLDDGVIPKKVNIVFSVLLAQLFLFLGQGVMDIIATRIMLFLSNRIGLKIISDYLRKLMKLPIKFFDSKLVGDLIERANDHERIERFLTSQSVFTLFSLMNFIVFFTVLAYFNFQILISYVFLTGLSIVWYFIFYRRKIHLDYQRFRIRSENLEKRYELLNSMQEIKLNNFEKFKQEQWEKIQNKLYDTNLKILNIDQKQSTGFKFINNLKNILVTFITAKSVMMGDITLGSMLSISYIIGEMNSPINQLISFFRSWQDAKISTDRMIEIQQEQSEESIEQINSRMNEKSFFQKGGFVIKELKFQYGGPKSPFVLNGISMTIPHGKITAIVGSSGSGKTTLMKLLLKFYEPGLGDILLGETNLKNISHEWLRTHSGVVMQDGIIFGDTIERNIVCGETQTDYSRLENAIWLSNIGEFIESLPLKLNTKIGSSGNGISGGQKQRILIARAVYKNPRYLFFDEATSSLDAENEKIIHDRLQNFFFNKTVCIIAHRLSTVKRADQIVVLKEGKIIEIGTHEQLVLMKSNYYNLVKNQLELGT